MEIVNYCQLFYEDAMKNFNQAIIEQQAAYEDFHPAVSEIRMKVVHYQLEIGKLQDVLDNFLEALITMRIVFGK